MKILVLFSIQLIEGFIFKYTIFELDDLETNRITMLAHFHIFLCDENIHLSQYTET